MAGFQVYKAVAIETPRKDVHHISVPNTSRWPSWSEKVVARIFREVAGFKGRLSAEITSRSLPHLERWQRVTFGNFSRSAHCLAPELQLQLTSISRARSLGLSSIDLRFSRMWGRSPSDLSTCPDRPDRRFEAVQRERAINVRPGHTGGFKSGKCSCACDTLGRTVSNCSVTRDRLLVLRQVRRQWCGPQSISAWRINSKGSAPIALLTRINSATSRRRSSVSIFEMTVCLCPTRLPNSCWVTLAFLLASTRSSISRLYRMRSSDDNAECQLKFHRHFR